jgi:hypothetical protein
MAAFSGQKYLEHKKLLISRIRPALNELKMRDECGMAAGWLRDGCGTSAG